MHPDVTIWCFLGYLIAGLGAGLGWHIGAKVVQRFTSPPGA